MSFVGFKTRSLGQILEKPCAHCRCHTFGPTHMKLGQNVCLNKVSDENENGHVRSKN